MTTTDSRKRFEKWANEKGLWMSKDTNGEYLYEVTRTAFDAWKQRPRIGISREEIESLSIHHFKMNGVSKSFVDCSDLRNLIKANSHE